MASGAIVLPTGFEDEQTIAARATAPAGGGGLPCDDYTALYCTR